VEVCAEIREAVAELRRDAELNENLYLAMVIANTRRKKRTLALCDVGNAMFRLLWLPTAGPDWVEETPRMLS